MDEDELEVWYDSQVEILTQTYKDALAKDPVKGKLIYQKRLKKLNQKYNKLANHIIKSSLRRYFFSFRLMVMKSKIIKPFHKLKKKIKQIFL